MKGTSNKTNREALDRMSASYAAIADFFDAFSLPTARKYLLSALKAAESRKIWNRGSPLDLLYLFERLDVLMIAAITLSKAAKRIEPLLIPPSPWYVPDITQVHQYCAGTHNTPLAWDYFPRALSIREYHDPLKALKKFTRHYSKKEWRELLHYIKSYALGANSLADAGIEIELVQIMHLLQKLLEASHLIHVRINPLHSQTSLQHASDQ